MTKRAVLYARINNHDERQSAEQLQTCRDYARGRGWQVVAELVARGANGLSDETPQLNRVLKMAQAGEFNVLVVREPNRLSRSLTKASAITAELEQAGIQILYVWDNGYDGNGGAMAHARMEQIVVHARVSDDSAWGNDPNLTYQVTALREHILQRVLSGVERSSLADAEDIADDTSPERLQVNERKRDQCRSKQ